ncbi:MAG: DNA polymerase-3 subunit epsilon [Flammeovirgaceae bacterium]|jgi:DNA polymerase-3 subunit epsilon
MNDFVAIDFETATGYRNSACAVGIVTVKNREIVDKFYSLIQPPENDYSWRNIQVHKIQPADTLNELRFDELYPTLRQLLESQIIVAHNEAFDRSVLANTMDYYGLDYSELKLAHRWECTVKIYKGKGYKPANLKACCERNNIELNHHEALSDALACAKLFLLK